ncbi:hybrid sensor histidine kinase/response regulator [Gloeothece verrucosa]|uniref:histidine kinase n=1 Tax=Gloeothece verrucosa (strain PCC 7822) TaxID=497965 RepID=E0U6N4_GLOV7|nr:ATP-binding protein [Gloeothece verrucosa]ADN14793.1 GAF sensor hybrid histidine kinase [Gloeothece verrucosa PCC 7822]
MNHYYSSSSDINKQSLQSSWSGRSEVLLTQQNQILKMIASGRPLLEILDNIINFMEKESGLALCSVLLLEKDGTQLRWGSAPSLPEDYNRNVDGLKVGACNGSCGTAVHRGEMVIVTDIARDPLWHSARNLALKYELRACTSVPIFSSKKEVLGTFAFYYRQPSHPSEYDLQLIEVAQSLTAIAIERQKMDEERNQLLLKEREARQEAEQLNRIKDEFVMMLSHELRTPLTAILGWSQLLKKRLIHEQNSCQKAIETIERNAKLESQLIDDLLDITKILTDKFKLKKDIVYLESLIKLTVDSLLLTAEAKEIPINIMIESPKLKVLGDERRLQQIFWNLVSNSIKFTEAGGLITIKLQREQEQAKITITDTGIGIKPALLPFVFDRFWQADSSSQRMAGGLGIGLSIVHRLVELHQGQVIAESLGEGKGATFTVLLPLVQSKPISKIFSESNLLSIQVVKDALKGYRILIVDDEPDTLKLAEVTLKAYGSDVMAVDTAEKAFTLINHWNPNLVISDLAMPGMNGYELLKRLQATDNLDLKIIALTAYVSEEEKNRALSAGFQIYLSKPIEPEQLVAEVLQIIRT